MTSAHAFIAFLRTEADQAEERARHLRTTAAAIEANSFTSGSKRRRKDPTKKRAATAYTLFVSENYELIRRTHDPNMAGKDVIALIARQWAATSEEEKELWKQRAVAQAHQELPVTDAALLEGAAYVDPDDGKKKKAKLKDPPSSAAV